MEPVDFNTLFNTGGYSLKALVELKHPEKESWYFTNNNQDIEWENKLYRSVSMSYKMPTSQNNIPTGGVLEIDVDIQDSEGNELLRWFDESDHNAEIEVIAIINDDGIRRIGQFTQKHGTVNWNGKKITWQLGGEDRLPMQVNPWVFNVNALIG